MSKRRSKAPIRWRDHLQNASMPLFMLASFALLSLIWDPLGLPTPEAMMAWLGGIFKTYGYWALGFSAFLEGIFMVSLYFPGSMVIFTALYVSDHSFGQLTHILIVCWTAFMAAAVVNYLLGYYGLYKIFNALGARRMLTDTRRWMDKYGNWAYAVSAIHPNWLAVVEVCSGIARDRFGHVMTLAGLAMCVTGPLLVYGLGSIIGVVMDQGGADWLYDCFIAVFAGWAGWVIGQGVYSDLKGAQA